MVINDLFSKGSGTKIPISSCEHELAFPQKLSFPSKKLNKNNRSRKLKVSTVKFYPTEKQFIYDISINDYFYLIIVIFHSFYTHFHVTCLTFIKNISNNK
ncbi:hypothetical protein WH96_01030 [Kiloniella spongiae]|uniref:Uncharacterized protein n=1 Tax=Kiloniella spongiae TaxID=1489064 RepID=A0A0H2MMZ0_9PROT|nr:hypothetical protein WH96_01030 [Kiloniella spongiae]